MSLAQIYRDQTAQRQARRLLLYVGVAAALHVAGAAILMRHLRQPSVQLTPIDFVYIEPQSQPVKPPVNPARQSQTNAVAGAKLSSRPPQSAAQSAARSAAPPAASSALPPSTPAVPRSGSAVQLPSPPRTRPAPTSQVEAVPALSPDRTADSPSQNLPRPAQSPAAGASGAAALTPSDFYSLSVESGKPGELSQGLEANGFAGQSSANRSGPGSSVDAAQSPWGGYLASLRQVIDQSWQSVPISATSRTRVQFRVSRAGELSDLRLLESSGNQQADEAALAAIQAAAPFAPLPASATENVLVVNFTFTQWLRTNSP